MAKISRIKPGQVLYTITSQKMGNTTMSRKVKHSVVVKEVDPDGQFVIASWNGNEARKYFQHSVERWKVNEPKPKGSIHGMNYY